MTVQELINELMLVVNKNATVYANGDGAACYDLDKIKAYKLDVIDNKKAVDCDITDINAMYIEI